MKYCSKKQIINLFELINKEQINYMLLRNTNNEIPNKLSVKKDIDLIIKEEDAIRFNDLLIKNSWVKKRHPLGHFPFLYGLIPFTFYYKEGIYIDICHQLACRSLNKGEWFPLDMQIQEDVWKNKRTISNKLWKYKPSLEDEFILLITRCVFDKKEFNDGYIERIEQLMPRIDTKVVLAKFEVIFFKFSKNLLNKLQRKEYNTITTNYIQFKDY